MRPKTRLFTYVNCELMYYDPCALYYAESCLSATLKNAVSH